MGSRKRKDAKCGFFTDRYWQSSALNQRVFAKNLDECVSLAMNRFRWVGLPETCDARYLEFTLLRFGYASICRMNDESPWVNLMVTGMRDWTMYGLPVAWRAMGEAGKANFEVTAGINGEMVYYNQSRSNVWNALELFARELTHYDRTESINLTHQQTPWLFIAPQEKKQELVNLMKQVVGGEPCVLGDGHTLEMAEKVSAISTGVPFIGEEINLARQNKYNQLLRFLGIPHLAFEKGERMIEDEARANTAPTNVNLLNCLGARRDALEKLKRISNDFADAQVVFNDDWESYNFNYSNNVESLAQDGLIIGGETEVSE